MEVIKTAASPSSVQPPASSSSSCSAPAPWLDLPEALTDLILDRLPLADYIRFEAVCTKWQSIQQDHRLRSGAPLPFPWLYVYPRAKNLDPIISLNPFDPADPPKCRSLPLPTPAPSLKVPLASSHGWLIMLQDFMDSDSKPLRLSLFHPVSGTHLPLPPLRHRPNPYTACMSSPPIHPDCAVIIPCFHSVYLWRAGQPDWTVLPCPDTPIPSRPHVHSSLFCGGKFYFLRAEGLLNLSLFVVDPFLTPDDVQLLDMGWSRTPFTENLWSSRFREERLVECNGDILMVVVLNLFTAEEDFRKNIKGLLVFRADFSRKMWVRVESLGDRALFVSTTCSFSLVAANVGVTENYIYFCDSCYAQTILWTAFDLGAGRVVHGPPVPDSLLKQYRSMRLFVNNFWIIPRLASVTPRSD